MTADHHNRMLLLLPAKNTGNKSSGKAGMKQAGQHGTDVDEL